MAAPDRVVNLDRKLALIREHWSPRIVGQVNDLHLKIAKGQGDFPWHVHEETDEFFLVIHGSLTIRMRDRDDAAIAAGEFFVVPRGVEHAPLAAEECEFVMLEPAGTVNTGDETRSELTAEDAWI
ncbi:MAG: cupin domain-containing protein [Chloroflexi bacterium]|nr:cupin domain-containing protein [Chloroflexota bacterium]MDA1145055.1 cupin domain-containing protein [Chloroflexota bacterium]MQC82940.1 cupin domain-containing protein [Chloroflexota bacterium]